MNRKYLESMDCADYCAIQSAISAVQVRLDQFGASLYRAMAACKEAAAVSGKCGPEPKLEATAEVCAELAMQAAFQLAGAVNELNNKIEGVLHV